MTDPALRRTARRRTIADYELAKSRSRGRELRQRAKLGGRVSLPKARPRR